MTRTKPWIWWSGSTPPTHRGAPCGRRLRRPPLRHKVVRDDLNEFDIRPRESYSEFASLLEEEAARSFDAATFEMLDTCPVCDATISHAMFEKWAFPYRYCDTCGSLFGSPGPSEPELREFISRSAALMYWSRTMLQVSAEARRDHVFRPRVEWMLDLLNRYADGRSRTGGDYGARHPVLALQLLAAGVIDRLLVATAWPEARGACREAGLETLDEFEPSSLDVLTTFESLEGEVDLRSWFRRVGAALRPGGLLFATLRAGSGFDMRLLGARAPNLLPPLHRVLPSVEGISAILAEFGFEALEISTPGQLDLQIVVAAAAADPGVTLPPFLDDLVRRRDAEVHGSFQEFLQQARLSSHLRFAARRR